MTNGSLTRRPSDPCDPTHACAYSYPDPSIFATVTGTHAMGVISRNQPAGYVQMAFNLHNDANNCTKWTMPYEFENVAAGNV